MEVYCKCIKYGGYVNKGQVFYKKDGAENWEKTESDYFVVSEPGKYDVKVVDVAGNESDIQKKETNPAVHQNAGKKFTIQNHHNGIVMETQM